MAKIDGNFMRIKVNSVALSSTNSVDFTIEKDYQNTTTQDSLGWQELHGTAGVRSMSGSFDGMYDVSGTYSVEDIIDNILDNGGLVAAEIGETISGGIYYTCNIAITNVSISGKNDTIPTFKGSFKSSGVVEKNTIGAS